MLPPRALARALKPLGDRGIEVIAAVRGEELRDVPELLRACDGEGVRCGLWPMLDDRAGRWPSLANAAPFAHFAHRVLDAAESAPRGPDLAFDLEPPIDVVSRVLSSARTTRHPPALRHARWDEAVALFEGIARRVRARGGAAVAAVVPMCLYDPGPSGGWQRVMGTPVDDIAWDHATAMLYTSIFEGWSRRALRREHARALLVDGCRRVIARFGERGGVSLGAVDAGALGDEPTYRDPDELADDVALCAREGVADITLFDYAGVLRRAPAAGWLDALTAAPREVPAPAPTRRVAALLGTARAFGRFGAAPRRA